MKLTVLFLLLLIFNISLQAKVGVKTAFSYSNIQNINSEAGTGYSIGLYFSFGRMSIETNYITRNATIRNIEVFTQNRDLYSYDVEIKTGFLEIPLLYNFIQLRMNKARISCYAGFAVSIGSADRSRLINKRSLGKLPPEVKEPDSYYQWNYDKGGLPSVWGNSTTGFRIGAKCNLTKMNIGLRYNYEFGGGISAANDIIMKDEKFNSLSLYLGYSF